MKHIGFVDYYLSEWHANNYPAWLQEASETLGLEYQVTYAWAEEEVSPVDGVTTDEWCSKMGVEKCKTLAELCEKSDVIVILSPSNPEKHLEYAKEVLPYGKRTYIDKTFAPDLEAAKKIFEIGQTYNTPFFSTSALRYSEEFAGIEDAQNIMVTGSGRSLEEYVIHLIEMTVSLLKDPAKRVKVEHLGEQRICSIVTEKGLKAAMIYAPPLAYSVTVECSSGKHIHKPITSAFFKNLITDMLRFFETGTTSFSGQETLEVMRIRDGILKADAAEDEWMEL